ncbi:MAG TPA: hypothetical protein ENJ06_06555, partial [Phycisphaeraceae bacterium]|nr:hypothetical protein [Phycisphaeraceae bacterium]
EPILWTNAHSLNPNDYIIVSPGTMGNIESTGLTHLPVENDLELLQDAEGDKTSRDRAPGRTIALINAEVPLQFRIRDVLKYVRLAPQNDREDLLRFVAQRELMRYMAPLEIDQILGPDRLKIGKELEKRIQQAFDNMGVKDASGRPAGAGVEVVFVGLSNVHPPKDVAESFQQVVQAEQESVRLIEEGRKEAISRLAAVAGSLEHSRHIVEQIDILNRLEEDPENNREGIIQQRQRIEKLLRAAGGTAAVKVNQAQSERWQVQMKEWAAALTFQARIATYQAAPNLYIWRKILEVYETKLAHTRLFVNATDGKAHIRIDLKSEVAPPAIEQVDTGE